MRLVVIGMIALLGSDAMSGGSVAQQPAKKIVVPTMMNQQSTEAIEFQGADCVTRASATEMACDFHFTAIFRDESDTCAVLVGGVRRVLRSVGRGTWESEPDSSDDYCGTSSTITLAQGTLSTDWTMTRRRTAPTKDPESVLCKKLAREEKFTTIGTQKVPACRVFRAVR